MDLGIIGTGRIAKRFVQECSHVPGADIKAVYNPHEGSAGRMIGDLGLDAEPLSDAGQLWELVNAVYIASPHETHHGYIMSAINAGKHVLCEKPLSLKESDAADAYDLAKEKQIVLMEGLKTAYCPGYKKLKEVAGSGAIGELFYTEACFTKLEDPKKRELTDEKYGGSFTELGSYVMLPMADLFGTRPLHPDFDSICGENGLDLFTRVSVSYPEGLSTLTCGLGVKSEGRLLIGGSEGYIVAEAPWWKTRHFELHFEDPGKTVSYDEEFEGDGLRYEIREFLHRIGEDPYCFREEEKARSVFFAGMMERFLSTRNGG